MQSVENVWGVVIQKGVHVPCIRLIPAMYIVRGPSVNRSCITSGYCRYNPTHVDNDVAEALSLRGKAAAMGRYVTSRQVLRCIGRALVFFHISLASKRPSQSRRVAS